MRVCKWCHGPIPPNRQSNAEYCSQKCNQAAYRARKKQADGTTAKPKAERRPTPQPAPAPSLNSREFERMMDGSIEDELRYVRDQLKKYLDDPATPANAISNIAARYIAVCEKLHDMAGGDDLLDALEDDTMEVSADAGASIV